MYLKLIENADINDVLKIYSPYVQNTAITFEYQAPTLNAFSERVRHYTEQYPWIVAKENNQILGYAYASEYRGREAYRWGCELSVYIHPEYQHKKLGKLLYMTLMRILAAQGYYTAYAVVSLPNDASTEFHKKLDFKTDGIQKNAGYKLGKWHDTAIFSKTLQNYSDPEDFPVPIHMLPSDQLQKILTSAICDDL